MYIYVYIYIYIWIYIYIDIDIALGFRNLRQIRVQASTFVGLRPTTARPSPTTRAAGQYADLPLRLRTLGDEGVGMFRGLGGLGV